MSIDEEKKTFVIKKVFENVDKEHIWVEGSLKRHFKAGWQIRTFPTESHSHVEYTLNCVTNYEKGKQWKIDTTIETKFLTQDGEEVLVTNHIFTEGKHGVTTEIEKEVFEKYLVNGTLSIECKVTINEMTGFERPIKRNFDESAKKFSDIVFKVKDQKFHVSKLYLASQSSYFESLLMGNFDESKQSEVELKDIDPEDFQMFLEVLYGEHVIDENNIEGILHLADMYDAKTVIGHCERFLLCDSDMELAERFILASRYKLEKLKEFLLERIDEIEEIEEILEGDVAGRVAFEDWKELLKLSISIHKKK